MYDFIRGFKDFYIALLDNTSILHMFGFLVALVVFDIASMICKDIGKFLWSVIRGDFD